MLLRHSAGSTYPYTLSGLVSLTNGWTGTVTSAVAYYYFYDWQIQAPSVSCTSSPRVPVTATVTTATGITALNVKQWCSDLSEPC